MSAKSIKNFYNSVVRYLLIGAYIDKLYGRKSIQIICEILIPEISSFKFHGIHTAITIIGVYHKQVKMYFTLTFILRSQMTHHLQSA